MSFLIYPTIKESPILGLTGMSGGVASLMYTTDEDDSYYSAHFDGTGDYLSMPVNNSDYDWAADGSLTIEAWVYLDVIDSQTYHSIINRWGGSGTYSFGLDVKSNGNLFFYRGNGSTITTHESSGATIAINTWYHVAVVKDGTTGRFFINGTARGTFTWNEAFTNSTSIPLHIGNLSDGNSYPVDGMISNARFTNGQALYTSNFTPSTEPLTTTSQGATASNVKLLCCNQSPVTGATVSTATITANGDTTVTFGNPFTSHTYDIRTWIDASSGWHYRAIALNGTEVWDGNSDPGSDQRTFTGKSSFTKIRVSRVGSGGKARLAKVAVQKDSGGYKDLTDGVDNGYGSFTWSSTGTATSGFADPAADAVDGDTSDTCSPNSTSIGNYVEFTFVLFR